MSSLHTYIHTVSLPLAFLDSSNHTQITHLERQLVDANVQVSELEEQKEKLERDVSELQSHVSQLQAETPRMNDEVVELRVKEMQQKVDMEAATRKRMEVSGGVGGVGGGGGVERVGGEVRGVGWM